MRLVSWEPASAGAQIALQRRSSSEGERAVATRAMTRPVGHVATGAAAASTPLQETLNGSARVQALAELQRAVAASPRVAQLARLTARHQTGSNTTGSARPVTQRRLEVDGQAIADPAGLANLAPEMIGLVNDLIALPASVKLTRPELGEMHRYRSLGTLPTSHAVRLAILQLVSRGTWTLTGVSMTNKKALAEAFFPNSAMLPNLADLGAFLGTNPNVQANLGAAGVGWKIPSPASVVEGMGGGAVMDEAIHLRSWVLNERLFMRMAVHEAGHATFQRMLLKGEAWSDDANRGKAVPDPRAMDADGRAFYDAWSVIRQQPQYFFLTDMPGGAAASTRAGRGSYLAGQFTEFCAESFMHMAIEKPGLQQHVATLPDTAPDIRAAWATAMQVLNKYEPLMLGGGGGGTSLLRLHRFSAALDTMRKALAGPNLEALKPDEAKKGLEDLRKAWARMQPEERVEKRLDAIGILDEFIMRIHRYRPAQAHLGAIFEFADL